MKIELNAILAVAQRDLLKFLRDRARLISTFIFPFVFVGLLGGMLQSAFGPSGHDGRRHFDVKDLPTRRRD